MPDPMQFAAAITTEWDADFAAAALTDEIHAQVDVPGLDYAMAFFTADFAAAAPSGADRLNTALDPRVLIGCTSAARGCTIMPTAISRRFRKSSAE
jgi:hypothetical protein